MRKYLFAFMSAALLATAGAVAGPAKEQQLPHGLATHVSGAGMSLARTDGRQIYRLELDRVYKRHPRPEIATACDAACHKLWVAVPAPQGFIPNSDWSVTDRPDGTHQLTYQGDPLYVFTGKSLAEAASLDIFPPYIGSYTAKPAKLVEGVPLYNVYWAEAAYQPPVPDEIVPAGISLNWDKSRYVFSDDNGRLLYVSTTKGGNPRALPDGVPLAAPLAAVRIGNWKPVSSPSGGISWSYHDKTVFAVPPDSETPARGWTLLQAH